MQKAVPVGVGAMAALLGLDYEAAVAVADEAAQGQVCQAANDNGGGQVVVSGDKAAVDRAVEIAKTKGAKRAMLLPVSAPFHCALMQPAADAMAKALADVTIKAPAAPLVSNVLAAPITDPDEIRRRLVEQVTGTVRWRESVAYMAGQGVTRFFEIGAGKVLSGLVKRIADGAVGVVGRRSRTTLPPPRMRWPLRRSRPERTEEKSIDVRSDWQDGARHRRDRRHRRRDRAGAACAGRDRCDFRHAARGAGCARRQARRARPCAALQSLRRPTRSRRWCRRRKQAMGQVDILVANAGITRDNLFVQLRDEDWDEVIKVNLTATFRLARAATKLMMRKRFGRIIAITSVVGVTGNPGQGNYTASKAGLIGMIKTLGAEYAKRNVTANCIAPGFIKTPMTDALNDKQRETILSKVPAARLGTPEDIAAAAVYLSSNEAGLRHRPDHSRQRRNGHDLSRYRRPCGAAERRFPRADRGLWSRLGKYDNRTSNGWAKNAIAGF